MIEIENSNINRGVPSSSRKNLNIRGRRTMQQHQFSSYLSFSLPATICIGLFLMIYIIVLGIFAPLLQQQSPQETIVQHGQVLRPVLDQMNDGGSSSRLSNVFKHIIDNEAKLLKKQIDTFRNANGISDQSLMDEANKELLLLRKKRTTYSSSQSDARRVDTSVQQQQKEQPILPKGSNYDKTKQRYGFIVLGMHRSGTSMLSGLLVNGMGYNVGGPLIGSAFDNEKGFFELIDAVLQNDEFFTLQEMYWAANIINYNDTLALEHKLTGKATFKHGTRALQFLNNINENAPYLQKDPRMCITLKTWLPLLNNEPAIVFTFRHPLEVAMSLNRREKGISIDHGLRIWIVYNMRALQNSVGLCRVYSSNENLMENPYQEVRRISEELTTKCNVPRPSQNLTQELVNQFVDPSLHHNNKKKNDGKRIITNMDGCIIYEYKSSTSEEDTDQYKIEQVMYSIAMKFYCDLRNGKAYEPEYLFPEDFNDAIADII